MVGEEPEVHCRTRDVVAGLGDRLAHIAGVGQGKLVGVLFEQVGKPVEQSSPLRETHMGPGAFVEGAAGGGHGGVSLRPTPQGDVSPWLTCPGIDGVEILPGVR